MTNKPHTDDLGSAGAKELRTANPFADVDDPDELALARRVRAERERMGLNQAQVADALSIPRAAVSAIETGRRRVSSIELKRLAELFGASVDRLLGEPQGEDPTTTALFRTTKALTDADRTQVLRFAEFLRVAGQAPVVEFEQSDLDDF